MHHRPVRGALAAAAMSVLALSITLVPAYAGSTTCKELGYADNLASSQNGSWGSATWTGDEDPTLDLVVNDGYKVTVCLKADTDAETAGTYSEGAYTLSHTTGKGISHIGLGVDELPVEDPTDDPTDEPTDEPTEEPTEDPTEELTDDPTDEPTDEPREPVLVDLCRFVHDQLGDRTVVFRNVPADEANELIDLGFVAYEPGTPIPAECLPADGDTPPVVVVLRPDVRLRIINEGDVVVREALERSGQVVVPEGGVQAGDGLAYTGQSPWLAAGGFGLMAAAGGLWLIRRRWFT